MQALCTTVTIDGLDMEVEYNRIKADPEVGIEAGVQIETVCFAGKERSEWIMEHCPHLVEVIEKQIMEQEARERD